MASDASTSDAALARRIAAEPGSAPEAEAELCARFAPRVRAYGLRHLRDASAADDLVQRVLMLVIVKLRAGEVREPERIDSFVLGSARLTTRSIRRDGARHPATPDDDPEAIQIAVEPTAPLDRDRLATCLGELSERERSVVVSTFFEEATAPEIADRLGIESGNVRVIRHRALARLRVCIEHGDLEATP